MYNDTTIVGKSPPLRGAESRVTGVERFVPDRSRSGALWMKILRSSHAHARIKKMDVRAAEDYPGVGAVLTYEDVPPGEMMCAIFNFKGKILEDRVRFVGDEVAAAAAETEKVAEEALELIKVDYEILPAVFDIEEALKPGAPDVNGTGNNMITTPPHPGIFQSYQGWGDVEKCFAEADHTIERELRTSSVYGGFFPPACIAEWDGDELTITVSHQSPFEVRTSLCNAIGIPENRVRIITPPLSGVFGMLNSAHRFYALASLLARKTGRPVIYKMTPEEFGIYKRRPLDIMRFKMGGKNDGTITALDFDQMQDNGGYGYKSTSYGTMHDIFPDASVKYAGYAVNANLFTSGCIRGVGDVPQAWAYCQAVNDIAEKMGLDPITVWKKNHTRTGDPRRGDGRPGLTVSSEAFDEMLDRGAEAIGWQDKWKGAGIPYNVNGPRKKAVGVAAALHVSGTPVKTTGATVSVNWDGTVQVSIGYTELGTGSKTTFAQICAEVLGLKIDDVHVIKDTDTDTVPFAPGTGASRAMHIGGSAVKVAALDARQQILRLAHEAQWVADILRKDVASWEDLDIADSYVFVKEDPERRASVREIVCGPPGPPVVPQIIGRAGRHDIPMSGPTAYITMVCFADVEVDTETGKIEVLKLISGNDIGRVVNPAICENQIFGGTMMSLGYALMEEIVFDPATGRCLNPALTDYWMPTSMDAPPVEVLFADNIDPVGPLGIKAIGEAPTICPHASIAGAVYNAIGVKINRLPMTPDVVLEALGRIKCR